VDLYLNLWWWYNWCDISHTKWYKYCNSRFSIYLSIPYWSTGITMDL